MRVVVEPCRFDQVAPAEQQAGRLRAAQALPAGKRHHVVAHSLEPQEVVRGRHVGSGVVQRGYAMPLAEPHEFLVPDLPVRLGVIEEEEHRRAFVDRRFQLLRGLDFDELRARVPDGMVVTVAMRLLDHDLVQHAVRAREELDALRIGARDARGGPKRQGGGATSGDESRLAIQELGDPVPGFFVQLVQVHVLRRRPLHRAEDLGRHLGCRQPGVRARGVQE